MVIEGRWFDCFRQLSDFMRDSLRVWMASKVFSCNAYGRVLAHVDQRALRTAGTRVWRRLRYLTS